MRFFMEDDRISKIIEAEKLLFPIKHKIFKVEEKSTSMIRLSSVCEKKKSNQKCPFSKL